MALKISNELKIGILVVIAVIALIFGLRFLSGSGLFESGTNIIGVYDNTTGLQPSSPVMLKGVQIGRVKEISLLPDEKIRVDMHINKNVKIPIGSVAQLATQSIVSGDKMVDMIFSSGNKNYLKDNDTVLTKASADLLGSISSEVSPIMNSVNSAVSNIDSISLSVNKILNAQTQLHLQNSFKNIDAMMAQLSLLVADLNKQTANINAIMSNINGFTGSLAARDKQLEQILANAQTATHNLTGPEIKNTLESIQQTSEDLKTMMAEIKSSEGNLNLLLHDRALYDNLNATTKNLDEILIDLKRQPEKYINLSVFPGKTKVVEVEKL